jgi:predicted metal-dependent hydrolase
MLRTLQSLITPPSVEQRCVQLADQRVNYRLKRSPKRRSIGLRIDDHGLSVSVPLRASESWLHNVLQEKAHWIVERLARRAANQAAVMRWAEGEHIDYLGELLTLCTTPKPRAAMPQQHGETLLLPLPNPLDPLAIERAVMRWYRAQALTLCQQRIHHYAALMQLHPSKIMLSSARTQWGSCTSRGTVRINWRLIKLPPHLLDYVVVHELAHLAEMNHSAAFWRVVATACPDYLMRRKELKACPM